MDRKLKILAISYLFPNRLYPNHGVFVLNRLTALSNYVDIKVINPIPWSPLHRYIDRYKEFQSIPLRDNINGLDIYHPRYFSIPKYFKGLEPNNYLKSIKPVISELKKTFDFDIVDMHWTFPDLPAGLAIAETYNKSSIVTLRGLEALHLKENNLREQAVKTGLTKVDRIIALSNELMQYGEQLSGHKNKSSVIINGVATGQFHYIPMQQCRMKLDIPSNDIFILSVGSLIKRKGFDLLISSLNELRKVNELRNVKLYIIGSEGPEGDFRESLYKQVRSLGLEDAVVFVGQVHNSQLKYWYNAANLFCLSSRGEGSPNVLSEALACGCPVVSSNVGSASDIIGLSDGNGVCMKNMTVNELTNSLIQVLNTQINRQLVSNDFSAYDWDWCAKNVLNVYDQCLLNKI